MRALSGVFGVVSLPLAWLAGRRLGGRAVAWSAVVLLALSPYALRYSTETRMYSLVMVLVLVGWLLVDRTLEDERPKPWLFVALGAVSGLLLLTHYWALWLVAATVGLLGLRKHWRPAIAILTGIVLFLPWVPSLLDQAAHTGTPWAGPARPTLVVHETLTDFGGGDYAEAYLLGFAVLALFALGLMARSAGPHRLELELRTTGPARPIALAVGATLVVACVAQYATDTTYASRYAAVFFPLVLLVAAVGLAAFEGRAARAVVAGAVLALGVAGAYDNVATDRTQAGDIAAAIRGDAGPDDVVVFCPDQLGPAVHRYLPDELEQVTYPRRGDPDRVDWVDYAERNAAADPDAFAVDLVSRTPRGATVWLVFSGAYRTLEGQCEQLAASLGAVIARGGAEVVVTENGDDFFEHASLLRFPPTS